MLHLLQQPICPQATLFAVRLDPITFFLPLFNINIFFFLHFLSSFSLLLASWLAWSRRNKETVLCSWMVKCVCNAPIKEFLWTAILCGCSTSALQILSFFLYFTLLFLFHFISFFKQIMMAQRLSIFRILTLKSIDKLFQFEIF